MHGRLVVRKVFSGWFKLGFYQTFVGGGWEVTNECCVGLNFKLMTHKVLKSTSFVIQFHTSFTSFIRESESMKYVCKNIIFDLTQTVFQMSHSKIGQEITLIIPKSLLFQTSCQV